MKKNIFIIVIELIIIIILCILLTKNNSHFHECRCCQAFNCKMENGKYMCNYMKDDKNIAPEKIECNNTNEEVPNE